MSFSQIIKQSLPQRQGKRPVRLLACGHLEDVNSIVHQLHARGFAQVHSWTPPVPSPVEGEVIRVLTIYFDLS